MARMLTACLAGMLLVAGVACAPFPGTLEQPSCEELFADLDRVQRVYGADTLRLGFDDRAISFPALNRPVRMLRAQGCITRVDDLAGIEQAAASLQPFERVTGGAAVPPQSVHVGVVDGFAGLSLATSISEGWATAAGASGSTGSGDATTSGRSPARTRLRRRSRRRGRRASPKPMRRTIRGFDRASQASMPAMIARRVAMPAPVSDEVMTSWG